MDERLRFLAAGEGLSAQLKDVLLESAETIQEQARQLGEARDLIEGLLEPRASFIHGQAHRWLQGLPPEGDATLELGQHPLDGRPVYGYWIKGEWVFDPRTTDCGRVAVNPYKTYALTTKEINVLDRANELLTRLIRLADQAKTLPSEDTKRLEAHTAFFDALRGRLSEDKRQRLEALSRGGEIENIDRALDLLGEG